jgi:hypothetical protein
LADTIVPPKALKLGTRASALALAQSEWVAVKLREAHPGLEIGLVHISTRGDRSQATETPLSSYSEKGIFAKELEEALLAGEIDFAVHSMKDMAASLPDGLEIVAVPAREDPRDVLVGARLADLPQGARVGTGSVRRRALLAEIRPDLELLEIRGNVDTRLRKLAEGGYDAIILAAAGPSQSARGSSGQEAGVADILLPRLLFGQRDRQTVRQTLRHERDRTRPQLAASGPHDYRDSTAFRTRFQVLRDLLILFDGSLEIRGERQQPLHPRMRAAGCHGAKKGANRRASSPRGGSARRCTHVRIYFDNLAIRLFQKIFWGLQRAIPV